MHAEELSRALDAIDFAAQRLGYSAIQVAARTDKIRAAAGKDWSQETLRTYVMVLREYDQPPQWATSSWLYEQLGNVIEYLTTDEQRAEEATIAARIKATLAAALTGGKQS